MAQTNDIVMYGHMDVWKQSIHYIGILFITYIINDSISTRTHGYDIKKYLAKYFQSFEYIE